MKNLFLILLFIVNTSAYAFNLNDALEKITTEIEQKTRNSPSTSSDSSKASKYVQFEELCKRIDGRVSYRDRKRSVSCSKASEYTYNAQRQDSEQQFTWFKRKVEGIEREKQASIKKENAEEKAKSDAINAASGKNLKGVCAFLGGEYKGERGCSGIQYRRPNAESYYSYGKADDVEKLIEMEKQDLKKLRKKYSNKFVS